MKPSTDYFLLYSIIFVWQYFISQSCTSYFAKELKTSFKLNEPVANDLKTIFISVAFTRTETSEMCNNLLLKCKSALY